MFSSCVEVILILSGLVFTVCNSLENTSSVPTGPPVAAAVRAHFEDCPVSHQNFCLNGKCRFLVQESSAACICRSGYIGIRCEHADLLAVVAIKQKQQAIATLVVVSVIVSVLLIAACVLLHCCRKQRKCELCRRIFTKPEASLLKSGSTGNQGDTGV
ncbi:protransforming growth factor alpha-like [Carcharodon carcharias]|uniref:protransforming growth factor alpha-like n=1 Tax=Carcharodon carcharias TaxID=13397 RepID=UPI001B7EE89C|nr:protransforming growth factor alpha-like [Carcharodon carcharias]